MVTAAVTGARAVLAAVPDVVLTLAEQARADALRRPVDRDTFVAARLLTRVLVARHTGLDVAGVRLVQTCARCGGPHGRPRVIGLDVHVGWAHSGGLVAAVVDDAPCAVDVETANRVRGDRPRAVLTATEQVWLAERPGADRDLAFAALWVRKEVLVKLGDVALGDVGSVDVLPTLSGRPVLGRTVHDLDAGVHDAVAAWAVAGADKTPSPRRAPG